VVDATPGYTAATEEYDGTSWTSVNSMNTPRSFPGGTGIQTAALAFGGDLPGLSGATEEYDGTNWTTSPANLGTSRYMLAGAGTQTAALGFGGATPPITTATEEFTRTGTKGIKTVTVS
jgi:hypothetical protein